MTDPQTIQENLDYGPAPESDREARAWLERRGGVASVFINGEWKSLDKSDPFPTRNPANGEVLTQLPNCSAEIVDEAVRAARGAQEEWWGIGGAGRARYLYALARGIQKNSRLFATLETLENGKPIRETRDIDVPLVARHFSYHAGWAQILDEQFPHAKPWGVCGQVIPWNFPLLMLSWKIAPALAAGNTVVLKPAEWTSLTALLFAELCEQVGLPPGVVNIVTGAGETGAALVGHEDVDKVAFTGSTEVGRIIRRQTAGQEKGLTLELGGKSPFIVFEDADLDSAIEGIVDAIWFNQGQVCCAGSRLLVAESIADKFHKKLETRMQRLRVGNPLDKAVDLGAMVEAEHLDRVKSLCDQAVAEGNRCVQTDVDLPDSGYWFPPTLFPNVSPASTIVQEEVFGPVLVSMTFRSPKEAIALANHTRYGLAASVWSQDLDTALHVARQLHAGTVWVNSTNLFDASSGFGGVRESGFGREGGAEGLHAYLQSTDPAGDATPATKKLSTAAESAGGTLAPVEVDRTAKLYIGGRQVRPDGGYSLTVTSNDGAPIAEVGRGNRKDIRNAVEAAHGARAWQQTNGHQRSQILWYLGENLAPRRAEFVERLVAQGLESDAAEREVTAAIDRVLTWASWADKYDGASHDAPFRGLVLALHEPVGVVGVVCPDEFPLLGFLGTVAPLLAMGNPVVAIPSERAPLAATDLIQVLETSDLPGGVLNVVTGLRSELVPSLAEHDAIDMIWQMGPAEWTKSVEEASAGNLKRTWCPSEFDLFGPTATSVAMLRHATRVKNLWLPHGV